ncbi:MAG TPA: DUF1015 domain-containing protein [Dehalococcoidia bacterium]|nr:DUF1015 domain-containing protein [Dehalococcoidia bacterium]
MADVRPFRALRYDPAAADPAAAIAPPYDVISPAQQADLYRRSPHNIVRIEYGEQRDTDTAADNRYTRAAAALRAWRDAGVLVRDDAPAFYRYTLEFAWDGVRHRRQHLFAAVRLHPWDDDVVRPHERTLSGPKQDRLELLRATRTQVSPVYCLYRHAGGPDLAGLPASQLYDVESDGQRHVVDAITDAAAIDAVARAFADIPLYIADGHHRYETALAYRDERRAAAATWTGDEPENFVLMALTAAADPGQLVLPTHRVVHRPVPPDALERLSALFDVRSVGHREGDRLERVLAREAPDAAAFVAEGLAPDGAHLLTLRDRAAAEALMPAAEPPAWKRLDVSVLQYAVLGPIFGIDNDALAAGGAVTYTQSSADAIAEVDELRATAAFLLRATPVTQVLDVADAHGRMPQKSTYFHPKLPTGLVLHPLD